METGTIICAKHGTQVWLIRATGGLYCALCQPEVKPAGFILHEETQKEEEENGN